MDVLAEKDHRCAATAEPVEDSIAPKDKPGRIASDDSFALVFGEKPAMNQRCGGALSRGQARDSLSADFARKSFTAVRSTRVSSISS